MTTKVVPGQLVAVPDVGLLAKEASTRLARALRDTLARKNSATLALSGGSTPKPVYELLASEGGLDWSKIEVFWIDERAVPPDDDRSNYKLARQALLDHVTGARFHRMPGDARDLQAGARDYERLLRNKLPGGGFDVAVMGVGDDGHTASLFPGQSAVLEAERWVLAVHEAAMNPKVPRITVTPPVIEACRAVFVLAAGASKQGPLERAWATSGTVSDTPARLLRGVRGSLTWLIDKAAGGMAG